MAVLMATLAPSAIPACGEVERTNSLDPFGRTPNCTACSDSRIEGSNMRCEIFVSVCTGRLVLTWSSAVVVTAAQLALCPGKGTAADARTGLSVYDAEVLTATATSDASSIKRPAQEALKAFDPEPRTLKDALRARRAITVQHLGAPTPEKNASTQVVPGPQEPPEPMVRGEEGRGTATAPPGGGPTLFAAPTAPPVCFEGTSCARGTRAAPPGVDATVVLEKGPVGATTEIGVEIQLAACEWPPRVRQPFGGLGYPDRFASMNMPPAGDWGGAHIRMVVSEAGARIEFDCAIGTIIEPLQSDGAGHFEAHGTYTPEHGGPRKLGEAPPESHPASYRGSIDGEDMRLTVVRLDTGEEVGSFQLGLARPALLQKCL